MVIPNGDPGGFYVSVDQSLIAPIQSDLLAIIGECGKLFSRNVASDAFAMKITIVRTKSMKESVYSPSARVLVDLMRICLRLND